MITIWLMFISDGLWQACITTFCLYPRQDLNISRMQMTSGQICFHKNKRSICWEYWCRARTRRVWSGVSVAPQLQRPAQPRGRDGPATDSAGPETGGDTCHQEHQQCSVRPAVRRSVNEETRLSVKIQFCFGRVPIHSWTWQIFFIINHMLARTHNLLPNAACSRYSENCNVWIEK